jgi:hypothetical protein
MKIFAYLILLSKTLCNHFLVVRHLLELYSSDFNLMQDLALLYSSSKCALGVFSQFDLRSDFHGQILTTFFHNGGFSQSQMAFSHKADFHNNFSQNPVTFHDEVFRESDVLQNCSKFYGGQICRTSLSLKTSSLKVTGF